MPVFTLSHRSMLQVSGPEAAHFLHNLVTADIENLGAVEIVPGALLSPQGKILFDFLASRDGDGFRLDCRADIGAELAKRLKFYRLRAKVDIVLEEQGLAAVSLRVEPAASESESHSKWLRDLRFPSSAKVSRGYGLPSQGGGVEAFDLTRIEHGVAEGGSDYEFGDVFPHDVNLDQIHGVSFAKGCYVGQEVVSRMQHRGTARRRIVIAHSDSPLTSRSEITINGRPVGALGVAVQNKALALVRIDKAKDAMDAGAPILAGGVPVSVELPPSVSFSWPDSAGADD
jgi:tRNA-modifying protein YgfZ